METNAKAINVSQRALKGTLAQILVEFSENAREVFWVYTTSGELIYVTPSFNRFWPNSTDDLKKQPMQWLDNVDEIQQAQVYQDFAKDGCNPDYKQEYRIIRADGSYCWVSDRCFPIKNKQGQLHRIGRITENISGYAAELMQLNSKLQADLITRKRMEAILRESEQRFRFLAENSTDMIARQSLAGDYRYISPACKHRLGYTAEEMIGCNYHDFCHPDDVNDVDNIVKLALKNRQPHQVVHRMKHRNGHYIWFETTLKITHAPDTSQIDGKEIHSSSRDISRRIAAEERIQLHHQQLANVAKMNSMGEMATALAHELNQPLAAISTYLQGCIERLKNKSDDCEIHPIIMSVLKKTIDQADRAGQIIHRLKNFFNTGKLDKSAISIDKLLMRTLSYFENETDNNKITIDIKCESTLPKILIDEIQIEQVIINLLQNACDALKASQVKTPTININVDDLPTQLRVSVYNNGPGISEEMLHDIFSPFFTTKSNGMGMGLAICRTIIEAHGGQLVGMIDNGRTKFEFTLPR